MRAPLLAAVSLLAGAAGAAGALAAARQLDWLQRGPREVRLVTAAEPAPAVGAARAAAFDPARIYRVRVAGVVTIYAQFHTRPGLPEAQGSGFVVAGDGTILTNSHVITTAGETEPALAARRVYVEFPDRDRVPARIVGWDVYDDVGVLKVDPRAHRLAPVPLGDSSRVVVGQPVAAIGSPFGNESSLTVGVVSATRRSIDSLTSSYSLVDAIQTDAPINRGNSGGPLFDARGAVIGINAQIRSSSGNAEGVGFAVPINSARRSMAQLLATGRVRYAFVGVETADVTPALARRLGLPVGAGAAVQTVGAGTGAAQAGLRAGTRPVVVNGTRFLAGGDVIVGIDDRPVRAAEDVARIVTERLRPGEVAAFEVVRGGKRLRLLVRLGERAARR